MVAVIATVRGQVKCNAQTLLSGRQILPVKIIRSLGSAESGILTNGPRSLGVHAGIRASQVGRQSGPLEFQPLSLFAEGNLHHNGIDAPTGRPRIFERTGIDIAEGFDVQLCSLNEGRSQGVDQG